MRLQHFIYSTLFTLGVGATLTGCYDYTEMAEEAQSNEAPIVLDLTIGADVQATRSATSRLNRALPMGGEDGDGREYGAAFENEVRDISLYYYSNPDGILSADATPIKRMVYVDNVESIAVTTTLGDKIKKRIPLKRSMLDDYDYALGDQFVVVANMGDVTAPGTLGELRNMLVSNAWTGAPGAAKSTYSKFVMSNEKNSQYLQRSGRKTDPHIITVDIERVAARIDFCSNGSERYLGTGSGNATGIDGGNPSIEYLAKEGSQTVGNVYVTHVRPFNVMQQPTFLIKRSALTSSETPVYLKNEAAYNETGFAYVVDPLTWTKALKPAKNTAANLESWYGNTRYSLVDKGYASNEAYRVHVNTATTADGFNDEKGYSHVDKSEDTANGFTDFYVLDYANENTMPVGATTSEVATGIVVRAIYIPKVVYPSAAAAAIGTPVVDYTNGGTFYRYRPMTTSFNETQCVYFDKEAEARAYGDAHPATPYIVEEFKDGVCYYITYLRHDNGDDYTPFSPDVTPMEYGIVRNNIYRLKCSFSGPGYPTIPPTPSFEPLGIKPYIFVRRWYQINHPEIEI